MERVSTAGSYNAVLANLMLAQQQLNQAGTLVSTQKNATDLKGYAANAETLMAMESLNSQIGGYVGQATIVSDKLTTQDTALQQIGTASAGATQAITGAIANGTGDGLMQQLRLQFQNVVDGLNTTYNGEYLFSGGQVNTPATSATSMSDLTSAPSVASLFNNDQTVTTSQITQSTSLKTGFLADQVGTPLYNAFQSIEAYDQGPNGPFSGPLTTAQAAFLKGTIATFNAATAGLTTTAAQNGQVQNQVTAAQTDLTNRQSTLQGMIGNITDADMAKASANLQQAQLALQASAQVFIGLQNSSLLGILTATGH